MRYFIRLVLFQTLFSSCFYAGRNDIKSCPAPSDSDFARFPTELADTGLFSTLDSNNQMILSSGVKPYTSRFPLWSDGADKGRYVWLPEGGNIDTSDAENWKFPVGTKFWKEFGYDSKRIETRMLLKFGDGEADWGSMTYLWADNQRSAKKLLWGAVDARGTSHNIPAVSECLACHGGRKAFVLGFSQTQLMQPLDELWPEGRVSNSVSIPANLPGSEVQLAALGYLHANCSHCHNPQKTKSSSGVSCFDPPKRFSFLLSPVSQVSQTDTYRTAIGSVIQRGSAANSRVIIRFNNGGGQHMPPLASEKKDTAGEALLREWIDGM